MAESSKEYAVMGRETWSAFQCSALAEKSKDLKEQERLFRFGYDKGVKFISALKSEKIKREDLETEVPVGVLFLLQGPSADFILGRVFENTLESALAPVYKTGDKYNSDEMQELIAKNEFEKRNCKLIGRKK
jgi:hypothetical protein